MRSKIAITLTLSFSMLMLFGIDSTPGRECNIDVLKALESDNPHTRSAAMERIVRNRDVPPEAIKTIAEKYRDDDEAGELARDAFHLLGKMHACELIPYLVSRLACRPSTNGRIRVRDIYTAFPAAGALIYIGLPSINPVVARLQKTSDEDTLLAGAGVLRYVLGSKRAIQHIEKELQGADGKAQESLEKVVKILARGGPI